MNSESILQSNLLDILFENRNKDYGAYVLRKESNKRLRTALFGMLGLVLIFCVLQTFKRSLHFIPPPPTIYDPHILIAVNPLINIKPAVQPHSNIIPHSSTPSFPPEIVKNNVPILADHTPEPSTQSLNIPAGNSAVTTGISNGTPSRDSGTSIEPIKEKPMVDKSLPMDHPDIIPQYPGGINALLKFLKSNLHSPDDLDAEVQVRVRFVVNYDGTLMKFDVTQSGGEVFDNEVVRVLKKMPKWIPGKSNGDNVAVWYTVPIKFTPIE